MKGLSLTLEIVIIAIVLLVTALVILTIFGGQIAKIIGVVDPLTDTTLKQTNCRNSCATFCMMNPPTRNSQGQLVGGNNQVYGTNGYEWSIAAPNTDCATVMSGLALGCKCS
jgi:hypothetical protein